MGFLATILVIWGLFWSIGIGYVQAFDKLGVFLLAWAPASLLLWFAMHRASQRDASHPQMLQEAGMTPGMGFDYAQEGTGIAINKQSKTLSLQINGFSKTYPYADVREWVSQEERAGQVVAVGLQGLAALGANARAAKDAEANTGFFVTVRDIDNPQWRIAMKDKPTRARWMELLRQEINEGGTT